MFAIGWGGHSTSETLGWFKDGWYRACIPVFFRQGLFRKLQEQNWFKASLEVKFKGGVRGVLSTCYVSGTRIEKFEMHGKGIAAYIEPPRIARIYKDKSNEPEIIKGSDLAGSGEFYRTYGFFEEAHHFVQCLKEDRQPDTNLKHAVKVMQLINNIHKGFRKQ